jgi:hypothetical protein
VFENNPYLWIGAAKKVRLDTLDELRRSILLDYPVNTFYCGAVPTSGVNQQR